MTSTELGLQFDEQFFVEGRHASHWDAQRR